MAKRKALRPPPKRRPEVQDEEIPLVERFRTAVHGHMQDIAAMLAAVHAHPLDIGKMRRGLIAYHQIGRTIKALVPLSEKAYAGYGEDVFGELGQTVSHTPGWIRKALQFHERYNHADLLELVRHADTFRLSHLLHLLPLSRSERHRVQQKVFKHKWTAKQLARYLQHQKGGEPRGGNQYHGTTSPTAALEQLAERSREWRQFSRRVLTVGRPPVGEREGRPAALDILKDLPPGKVTKGHAERLREARDALSDLLMEAKLVEKRLNSLAGKPYWTTAKAQRPKRKPRKA